MPSRPRIAIAGMSIESSTFSPHRSGFEAFDIRRDERMFEWFPFLAEGSELRTAAEWVPLVRARSLPGGAVLPEVYEQVKAETLQRIADEGPFDGLLLDIHGAMNVVGMDDAEGDFATAIREALGERTVISATMDLHGNVTEPLIRAVDLITCYRMAPHEDWCETKERATRNLVRALAARRRPARAWVHVPILLPGEKTSTRLEPATSLYAELPVVEAMDGVIDAAVWIGYAWADEPRSMATVVVTGDDEAVIAAQAERLARQMWRVRDDFEFVAPAGPLAECLDVALASSARPFFISDSGDNPTAGGTGDVTWTLTELIADPRLTGEDAPRVLVASIFDPDAVAWAFAAGEGGPVVVDAGARIDHGSAGPVRLDGVVHRLTEGDETSGRVAVIRVGGVHAIVTERRKPYHTLADFQAAGLDPREADLVVVKIGYLEPELYEMAADWRLGLTPGGVDQDLLRLGHHRITRPMFPFDPTMPDPDLSAAVAPARP